MVVVVVPVGRGFEPLLFPVRLRFKAGVVPFAGAFGLNWVAYPPVLAAGN